MARADFYLIAKPRFLEKPLLLVCELARKACDAGQPLLLLANSAAQAEVLDELLWEFDPDAYVPHQVAGVDEDDELAPVLIVAPEFQAPMRPLVLNLRLEAVPPGFERVLEVVPADAASREPSRARWKEYAARGDTVTKHDM
jgi:DNA polymerase-3 subunit chi